MTHPLYTFGYSGRQPEELLVLAGQLRAVVADTTQPRSRLEWRAAGQAAE